MSSAISTGSDLHVVLRGVVIKDVRIYTRGQVWGTDIILSAPKLRQLEPARALTYVQIYSISADELCDILSSYPSELVRVRASALWLAVKVRWKEASLQSWPPPFSSGRRGKGGKSSPQRLSPRRVLAAAADDRRRARRARPQRGILWFAREIRPSSAAIVEIVESASKRGIDVAQHFEACDADGSGELDFDEV